MYAGSNGAALFVRPLDSLNATRRVTGTVRAPFISPDGQWVGFVESDSILKRSPSLGGRRSRSRGWTVLPRSAAWLPDDTIVFATAVRSTGLQLVAGGRSGDVSVLTRPDVGRGEHDHLWPEALPGRRAVLYTITTDGGADAAQIAVLDLTTGTSTVVLRGGSHAHYVPAAISWTPRARRCTPSRLI